MINRSEIESATNLGGIKARVGYKVFINVQERLNRIN